MWNSIVICSREVMRYAPNHISRRRTCSVSKLSVRMQFYSILSITYFASTQSDYRAILTESEHLRIRTNKRMRYYDLSFRKNYADRNGVIYEVPMSNIGRCKKFFISLGMRYHHAY